MELRWLDRIVTFSIILIVVGTALPYASLAESAEAEYQDKAGIHAQTAVMLQQAASITITEDGFVPSNVTITSGENVTWKNQSTTSHILMDGAVSLDCGAATQLHLPLVVKDTLLEDVTTSPGSNKAKRTVLEAENVRFSQSLGVGESFTFQYNSPGTYPFHLATQCSATGTISVTGGGLLSPIGNQTAHIGNTLTIQLSSDRTSTVFSVTPLPLPDNASFNIAKGVFKFRPQPGQQADYQFTFRAADRQEQAQETIVITVPAPDSATSTSLQGRILDANDADNGLLTPIVDATVRLVDDPLVSTKTDSNGYFELVNLQAGEQYVEYDGSTAAPSRTGAPYGAYRSQVGLFGNVSNVIDRPIYIMAIDETGQTQVDPTEDVMLINSSIGVTVTIKAHTVLRDDGSEYSGPISISEVPDEFTPGSLPEWLDPAQVFTVQPMGLTFQQPAPVIFPNITNLPIGTQVDIWSMDHESAQFFVAGQARVTSPTTISTISGGIRESSWHFTMPPPTDAPTLTDDSPGDHNPADGCTRNVSSEVEIADGCLRTHVSLPSYMTQGRENRLTLTYNSQRAHPYPMVSFTTVIPRGESIPSILSYALLEINGLQPGSETFFRTRNLSPFEDSYIRGTVPVDGTNFATGIYTYTIRITKHYVDARVSSDLEGNTMLINGQRSGFGVGWDLAGLQRLYPQPDGKILLTDGDGSALTFYPVRHTIGALDSARSGDFSFLSGDEFDAARDAVRSSFTGVAFTEFNQLTNEALQAVNILVMSSADNQQNPMQQPLTSSEKTALADFVRSGGCAVIMVDWPNASAQMSQSMLEVFGVGGLIGVPLTAIGVQVVNPQGSPITSGNYGIINSFVQDYPAAITTLGPFAQQLAANQQGAALAVIGPGVFSEKAGPVVLFSDTNTFSSSEQGGLINRYPINRQLLLNTIDYCRNNTLKESKFFQGARGDYSHISVTADGGFIRSMKDGTQYRFDVEGRQTAYTDRNGNTFTYSYNDQGNLAHMTDPVDQVTIFTYVDGYLAEITDPTGRRTAFSHDGLGNLTQVNFPDGSINSFGYDDRHLMTTETDERGFAVSRVYDRWGRLQRAILPGDITRELTYAQSVGLVDTSDGVGTQENPAELPRPPYVVQSTVTDGEGRTLRYGVNTFGQANSVTTPSLLQTGIGRDANGNITTIWPPSFSTRYSFKYDDRGNQIEFTDRDVNHHSTYTYEPRYNRLTSYSRTSVIDNPIWQFGYDDKGNLTHTSTPLGRTVEQAYNPQGLPVSLLNTLGTESRYTYNDYGNLETATIGPVGAERVDSFLYDEAGDVTRHTDAAGRVHEYKYDSFGRVTQESLPGNRTVNYSYDSAGNLSSVTPPGKPAHNLTYDALGYLIEYAPPAVTGSGATKTSYGYNKAQQLSSVIRPDNQTMTYVYDSDGRMIAHVIPSGTITYSYQTDTGRLAQAYAPDGVYLAHSYTNELLTAVNMNGPVTGTVRFAYSENYQISSESVNTQSISIIRDVEEAVTRRTDFNRFDLRLGYAPTSGLLMTTTLDSINDIRQYNAFGEMSAYVVSIEGADVLFDVDYKYDSLGRIVEHTETISNTTTTYTYAYDAVGRLASVSENGTPTAYTYDANGNRLPGNYDAQDRLLSSNSATYTYTANGELLTKAENGETWNFEYDVLGNLKSVVRPNGDAITYLVDAQNRRVGKRLNGELVYGLLYRDQLNPIAQLNEQSELVSFFIYGSRPHVPDAMIKDGVNYRFVTDHLGSVRLVINSKTGNVAQRLDYDVWGNVLLDSAPGFQPFGFAGGVYDHQTGLVRFGARDYDPAMGRWMLKDPITFGGGELNVYAYAANDPVNYIDVRGTWVVPLVTFAVEAVVWLGRLAIEGGRMCMRSTSCREKAFVLVNYYADLFSVDTDENFYPDILNGPATNTPIAPPESPDRDGDGMPDAIDAFPDDRERKHPWDPPKTYEGDFPIESYPCFG